MCPTSSDSSPPVNAAAAPLSFPEFVWIWNRLQGFDTPDVHLRMARWLVERRSAGDRHLLLLAFRSSGKSTVVGLFSAWLLLRNPDMRILTLAADFALAKKMVRNVKRVIERHPFTRHLKPSRADQWASDQFTVRRRAELRDPSMLAKGIGSNITGLRADVIICDDVEVPNTCDTQPKRTELRDRLQETDYVLVPTGFRLFIGTPHTYYSIYSGAPHPETGDETPFLEGFTRLEIPALNAAGESAWPERFPADKLDTIRKRTGPSKFNSQMLLQPVNHTEGRLNPDLMKCYESQPTYWEGNREARLVLEGKRLLSASCWWDPAYGAPNAGDASVVACVFTDECGDYWLHSVRYLEHDPERAGNMDAATYMCRQVATFVDENALPAITLEINGIGRFLPGLLRRELAATGVQATVLEHTSKRRKDLRILEAFDVILAAGRLHTHRSVWHSPFAQEMREWRPEIASRDDGLDAVAGCLLSEPIRLPRIPTVRELSKPERRRWSVGQTTHTADTSFAP